MFRNALICHQECGYGKFMTLKDPKIVAFKMINCVDYINLRPTGRSDQGVGSCLGAHCWAAGSADVRPPRAVAGEASG